MAKLPFKLIVGPPPNLSLGICSIDVELFNAVKSRLHRPTGTFACAAFCVNDKEVYVVTNEKDLLTGCRNVSGMDVWSFHNALFDLSQLRRYGVKRWPFVWDTYLIERILWGGWYDKYGLEDCVRRELGILMDKSLQKDFAKATELLKEHIEYNAMDAWVTRRLTLAQMQHVSNYPEAYASWVEVDYPAMLAVMNFKGFPIDDKRWLEVADNYRKKADALEKKLKFNPASWIQTRNAIKERLKIDIPSTGEDELVKHIEHKLIKDILQFREWDKRANAYGKNFLDRLWEPDGKIYAPYNVIGAETGRMSSGMQQIPARDTTEYRECFIASKGHVLIDADYGAQEPRTLAEYSKDTSLLTAFENGEKVHLTAARAIFQDDSLEKGDKRKLFGKPQSIYDVGKAINLASSYGMTPIGLALHLGISVEQAQQILNRYFSRFGGVLAYIREQRIYAKMYAHVVTLGKRRIWVNPYNRQCDNNAINDPIQGTAAEIVKRALGNLYEVYGKSLPVVATVHDEIVMDVLKKELKKHTRILGECMIEAINHFLPNVSDRGAVEIHSGPNWAEAKK